MSDWIDSLERDIEVTEGQIALASILPNRTTVYVNVEVERLRRLLEAAKSATNRKQLCIKGGKHAWIGDDAGDSWCEKCGEVLFE